MIKLGRRTRQKFCGGLVGSALGDAIGEICLYKAKRGHIAPDELYLALSTDDLLIAIEEFSEFRYTDDTAMAIGLAESLIAQRRVETHHLGDRFRVNLDREPWRGYANGPPAIMLLVEQTGLSYVDASRKVGEAFHGKDGSYGNGAAMRVTPLGLFSFDANDLHEQAAASALTTHTHPIAADGAAIVAGAVSVAVGLDPRLPFDAHAMCHELLKLAQTPEMADKMRSVAELTVRQASAAEAADMLGRGVSTQESVPFAIYSFLTNPSSFPDCLMCAVTNGGDADTLGAMACGISGAYLGIGAIPDNWIVKLENRIYIEQLASWLWEAKFAPDGMSKSACDAIARWGTEAASLQTGVEELEGADDI